MLQGAELAHSIRATLGEMHYVSGQIAKKIRQHAIIHTLSATMNVRGRDFKMIVGEIGGSMITV